MKRIAFILAFAAVALTAVAGIKSTIKGNQKVTTEERTVDNFDAVSVSSGIDLYLTQGNTNTLKLEADENLMKHIKTEVKNGTLKIYSDETLSDAKSLKAHLTFKALEKISGSAGADVFTENTLKADEMKVNMSSGSDLKMTLESSEANFNMSSGSDAIVKYIGENLTINASSGSDFEINADELDELVLDISSGSDVKLHGSAATLKVNASSGSDLDAFDFVAVNAIINASSACNAKITMAGGNLTVNASSASSVRYKGKVKNSRVNASSLASVKRQ